MKTVRKSFLMTFLLIGAPLFFTQNVSSGEAEMRTVGVMDEKVLKKYIEKAEEELSLGKEEFRLLKNLGIACHNLGALGIKNVAEQSVEYLEKARKLKKSDVEVLAYLGSAKTLVARDSWNLMLKISLVNKGVNMIDLATKRSPDNFTVRMVRAYNSLKLPKFFNRRPYAKKDFLKAVEIMEKDGSQIDSRSRAEVYYNLGSIFHSEGDKNVAARYFSTTVNTASDSDWAQKAKSFL